MTHIVRAVVESLHTAGLPHGASVHAIEAPQDAEPPWLVLSATPSDSMHSSGGGRVDVYRLTLDCTALDPEACVDVLDEAADHLEGLASLSLSGRTATSFLRDPIATPEKFDATYSGGSGVMYACEVVITAHTS